MLAWVNAWMHRVIRAALHASQASLDTFLVVLELHDERLDVFAFSLPGGNGVLCVRVEVLLLLIDKSLCLEGVGLGFLEFPDGLGVFLSSLSVLEVGKLAGALSLLFAFLLFSQLKLLVADSPEPGKVAVLSHCGGLLSLLSLDLELTASLYGGLHFGFPLLLLLVESVCSVFGLGHLPV